MSKKNFCLEVKGQILPKKEESMKFGTKMHSGVENLN